MYTDILLYGSESLLNSTKNLQVYLHAFDHESLSMMNLYCRIVEADLSPMYRNKFSSLR